jgi:hypothetical protein
MRVHDAQAESKHRLPLADSKRFCALFRRMIRSAFARKFSRALVLASALGTAASAHAQTGPFFEPKSLEANYYELRVSADYRDVVRSDFSRPVFLFAQGLNRLHARQGSLQLDLRLRITRDLALQVVLPFLVREVSARSSGLLVSEQQYLSPRDFAISGVGLGDPSLALAYRLFDQQPWAAYAELAARVPVGDNPQSQVLAARVPLGTGQHEVFARVGASLALPVALSLAYRFGFSPGEHASYLVRRVGTQSFISGALEPIIDQRIDAAAELPLSRRFSLRLASAWVMTRLPVLVEHATSQRVVRETWSNELDLAAAVRCRISASQRLELHGELPIISVTDLDPFFPIVIPARGVGVTWFLVGS